MNAPTGLAPLNRPATALRAPRRLVYAIGDIHGRLDLLKAALLAIADHAEGHRARLVFLGDYVDRGPESRAVVEMMMALQRDPSVTCLRGNHEELMVRALNGGRAEMRLWLSAGGQETLTSYGVDDPELAAEQVPAAHRRWMAGLPLTSGDGHRIYVHAGLMPDAPLEAQRPEWCLSIRDRFLSAPAKAFEAHIVHGHTPAWAGKPDREAPELLAHRTNLDTGAYLTGVLTVGVFDEETPGGPLELLSVGPPMGGRAAAKIIPLARRDPPASETPKELGWIGRVWPRGERRRLRG